MAEKKYITLKEAAELSGYSADYVGQLIRQGKIAGKKVYSNIAWMTTEDSILKYLEGSSGKSDLSSKLLDKPIRAGRRLMLNLDPVKAYGYMINFSIGVSIFLFLLIFYIFSTAIDNRIEQKALQSANFEKLVKDSN